ncbi:YncE family protein [Pseudonocardia benzenivorans]
MPLPVPSFRAAPRRRPARAAAVVALAVAVVVGLAGCTSGGAPQSATGPAPTATPGAQPASFPGMPPVSDPHNVYSDAGANMLSDAVRTAKPLVYVPHTKSGDVWTIDPATFQVVGRYRLGGELQHVVPSWDMKTLYATDDTSDKITPFDPVTGLPGKNIPVVDPYNMYFTPDGKSAISVAEARRKLVFYDPHTWQVQESCRRRSARASTMPTTPRTAGRPCSPASSTAASPSSTW